MISYLMSAALKMAVDIFMMAPPAQTATITLPCVTTFSATLDGKSVFDMGVL